MENFTLKLSGTTGGHCGGNGSHQQKPLAYLPFEGRANPSSVHVTSGVGFPVAEHFSETAGPGCKVCSMKLYSSTGGASVEDKKFRIFDEDRKTSAK